MLKRPQDGGPKFPIFCKNRPKMLAITVCGPRCLLEASKTLPRASQDPSKSRSKSFQEAPESLGEVSMQAPKGFRQGGLLHVHATAFRDATLTFPDATL